MAQFSAKIINLTGSVLGENQHPEGIDALLSLWPIFEAFNLHYVSRGMLLDAEKNGSAPSLTGTSAGAVATARPAKRNARTAQRD
jgi:hypothetical protein